MAVEIKMAVGFDEWLWSGCGKKVANKRSQIVTGGFSEFYHLLRYTLGATFQWAQHRGPSLRYKKKKEKKKKVVISIDGRAAIIPNELNEENSSLPATTISNRVRQPSNSRS